MDGAELDVLNGAYNTLSRNDLILFIETRGQDAYCKIIQIPDSYNFRIIFEKNTKRIIAKNKVNTNRKYHL